jgi:hypothetical protein
MLEVLRDKVGDRKLFLFAVACCRRIWPFLHSNRSKRIVELVERVVNGQTVSGDLKAAALDAWTYADSDEGRLTEIGCSAAYAAASIAEDYPGERPAWIADRTANGVRNTYYWIAYEAESARGSTLEQAEQAANAGESLEEVVQITLLRDVFGNPFRPMAVDPSWLTWNDGTVVKLAQGIYDDRAFDRLPILADALEEGGCDDADILTHCRQPGEHVRGCWVVDLLLGKE